MLPSQSVDFSSLHEDKEHQKEIKSSDKMSGISLNEKYGLRGNDPYEAFGVFRFRFGDWVKHKAWQISVLKGIEQESVEQYFWLKAWEAAIDDNYDATAGKSIIGWIHQRIQWSFINLTKEQNPELLLESFRTEESSLEPEDKCSLNSSVQEDFGVMGGSQSYSSYHKRFETIDLINRILEVVQDLPYEYRAPVMQILDPSDTFLEYVKKDEEDTCYDGAAHFELCSSRALFGFTGSSAKNLKIAAAYLCKKIPELRDMKF